MCAAGGEPDISLRGPRRNVSITQAARTARAFPLLARLAGCRPLLAAPPGRRAGTLCKCNLSAGPAPAGKSRAGLPGTRRGAARSELEGGPFISDSDRESDAWADGRPGLVPSRRLCATLAALLLFVPPRPCASSAGLSLSVMSLLSDSRIFSCPSPRGPVSRFLSIPPNGLLLTSFPSPGEQRVNEKGLIPPFLRQPVGGRLGSPACLLVTPSPQCPRVPGSHAPTPNRKTAS